jgi:hypothetical protein
MPSSTSHNSSNLHLDGKLDGALGQALAMGVLGAAVTLAYGLSEATVVWQRHDEVAWLDIVRLSGAAGIFGALPAFLIGLVSARLEDIPTDHWAARALFWSVPIATLSAAGALVTTAPPTGAPIPWWILPAGLGLLVYLGWKRRLFWRAPAALAALGFPVAGVSLLLFWLEWGAARLEDKGPLPFALVGMVVAVALVVAAMLRSDLHSERFGKDKRILLGAALLVAACMGVLAWLPSILPQLYVFTKLLVTFCVAMTLAYLCAPLFPTAPAKLRRIGAIAGACVLACGLGAATWLATQPVPKRFGAFSYHSMVGLVGQVLSLPDDADGDGFYAKKAGGTDPDDTVDHVFPFEPAPAPNLPEGHSLDEPARHVIVFVIDALRAEIFNDPERLAQFPFFECFVGESVRFERAYAPGTSTHLSLGSILSGVDATKMIELAHQDERRRELLAARWMGQLVEDRPKRTGRSAFFMASPYTWMTGGEFAMPADLLDVDSSSDAVGHLASPFADRFIGLIDAGYFDAGESGDAGPTVTASYLADPHAPYICADGDQGGYECYLEEIAGVDRALERIYEALKARGVLDEAVVVITADHGESFGEDGYLFHGSGLVESQMNTALAIRLPDATPAVVETPVSTQAMVATAADALHLSAPDLTAPDLTIAGLPSLLRYIGESELEDAPAVVVQLWSGYLDRRPIAATATISAEETVIRDWRTGHVQRTSY